MGERLNKSIEILEKTAKNIKDKKIYEEKKENQERADLMQKIQDLRPRITDLIEAGRKCQELGIAFPTRNEMPQFGYDSRFVANRINHDLGFITMELKIRFLGIQNGGFNGPWDFLTDGKESFSVANRDYLKRTVEDPQISDMKKFLKQFEVFESAFYQWIDSLNGAEETNADEADADESVKRISLRNLYENGIKSLTFGTGEIVLRDGRYVLEHDALPFIEDGEELKFQFFADASDGERFALGTSKEEHGVYFTQKEYELAVENPAFLEVGKTYRLAGYDWTACEVDNKRHVAVIQSHGVTHGVWPGFKMAEFGSKVDDFYALDIDGEDISNYDNMTQALYDAIKNVECKSAPYGKGLYLISRKKAGYTEWSQPGSGYYWQALKTATEDSSLFEASYRKVWLSNAGSSNNAWYVSLSGICYGGQHFDGVVAPAFNIDLSKVEVVGDEIVIKANDNTDQHDNQSGPAPYRPYRSIWEYGMNFKKDGQTVRFTPEMLSLVYEAIKEDNGRKCVATFTDRKFTTEQYIAVCEEVENLLAENSGDTEYRACEHVLGKGFDIE